MIIAKLKTFFEKKNLEKQIENENLSEVKEIKQNPKIQLKRRVSFELNEEKEKEDQKERKKDKDDDNDDDDFVDSRTEFLNRDNEELKQCLTILSRQVSNLQKCMDKSQAKIVLLEKKLVEKEKGIQVGNWIPTRKTLLIIFMTIWPLLSYRLYQWSSKTFGKVKILQTLAAIFSLISFFKLRERRRRLPMLNNT